MAFDYTAPETGRTKMPASPHSAGEVYEDRGRATIDVSVAASDVIGLCRLPKGCVPVDFIAGAAALDGASSTSAQITFSVGVANDSKDDLVASTSLLTVAAGTIGQAGGIARMNSFNGLVNIKAKNVDRIIAAKIGTGPASASSTSGAIEGDLEGCLFYRAAEDGEWSTTLT